MSSFLITGGAGFIGSHLAGRCLLFGHNVVAVDDLNSGGMDNVEHLIDSRFSFVQGDVCDHGLLGRYMADATVVFHLAASTASMNSGTDWRILLDKNHRSTVAVLEAAAHYEKKVVLASSCDVYRDDQKRHYTESHAVDLKTEKCQANLSPLSKIIDERLAAESSVSTVIARLAPTIGPRMGLGLGSDTTDLIVQGMIRAIQEEPFVLDGGMPDMLNYIDVNDVVHWLLLLGSDPRADGHTYNIGRPSSISIEYLHKKMAQVVDSRAGLRDRRSTAGCDRHVVSCKVPDITQITELTGYRPRFSLDDTLRRIYSWIRSESRCSLAARAS